MPVRIPFFYFTPKPFILHLAFLDGAGETAALEQNMTEAANVLFVTQPTLSRQMADLEKELGKKLFVRTNRSTTLTEEGMHLRQRAEEILALVDQTKEEILETETF